MAYPEVKWDFRANAAIIRFSDSTDSTDPGWGLPVEDGDGNIVAILHFASDGELIEVELLDAEVQMPKTLRQRT